MAFLPVRVGVEERVRTLLQQHRSLVGARSMKLSTGLAAK
jgi:hypothetical protein